MENFDHNFTINISNNTKAILFLFEKKSIFKKNIIIGSNVIEKNNYPNTQEDKKNMEEKTFEIYEPVQNISKDASINDRRVFGKMIVQFSLTEPIIVKTIKLNYNKMRSHKPNGYYKFNENKQNSYNLFDDDLYIN